MKKFRRSLVIRRTSYKTLNISKLKLIINELNESLKKMRIKITEKRKKAIKKNYEKLVLNPPKRKNELMYFNRIKAGKERYKTAFKSKTGQIQSYPERFINEFIKPFAATKGMDVRMFLKMKSGRETANLMFKNERLDWSYNFQTIESFFKSRPQFNAMFIFDGDNKYKVTEIEMRKYLSLCQQTFAKMGRRILHFRVSHVHSFSTSVFWLPNLSKTLKLYKQSKGK